MSLLMVCLLAVGRIRNLVRSSPDVLQFSQLTKSPDYARDCRPVEIYYFGLWFHDIINKPPIYESYTVTFVGQPSSPPLDAREGECEYWVVGKF